MPDSTNPILSFRFIGGDADVGQLNFYDASRFQYGAARFVYTLEHFRQTGRVLQKITERINVDYRVPAVREGSWILDVLQLAGPVAAEVAIKVPLQALIAYVIEKLTPGSKARGELVKFEEQRTAQEQERTKQEVERTKQISALAATNDKALELISDLVQQPRRSERDREHLNEIREEIVASKEREQLILEHQAGLSAITEEMLESVLTRCQSQVVEMGKPLMRSANRLEISGGDSGSKFVDLNRRTVETLSGNEVDQLPTSLLGSIVRYDKESGWGKFRNQEFKRPISFVVPAARKGGLNWDVIDAMKSEEVNVVFYYVRDKRKVAKHLIFDSIIDLPAD